MRENDLPVSGKGAQHVRRLAIVKRIEAAAQGFAIDGNRCGEARTLDQTSGMIAEDKFHMRGVKAMQDETQRGVGWRTTQRQAKRAVQAIQVRLDEGMNLTIRSRSRQHRQHREQQDRRQWVHLPLAATRIGNLAEQRQQRAWHRGNLSGWLLAIDSDKMRRWNRPSSPRSENLHHIGASVEQPCAGASINAAILMLDSSSQNVSGGLTSAEEAAITANAINLNSFLGAGGSLFSQANNYGFLSALAPGLVVSFIGNSGITLTAAGSAAFPGLTNQDLSAGPYHAEFRNVGAIPVLGTGPTGNIIIGASGGSITNPNPPSAVPEPASLALFGLGMLVLGAVRNRNKKI